MTIPALALPGSSSLSPTQAPPTDRAQNIAAGFLLSEPFDPWITNGHWQSILGFFLRESCSYVPGSSVFDALSYTLDQVRERMIRVRQQQRGETKKYQVANQNESPPFWDVRERIETPDGDWFHADTKFGNDVDDSTVSSTIRPIVILLHGLQSSSDSALSQEMARAFVTRGMTCTCLNFRGCSGQPNDTLGGYHLGFTNDLQHYLQLLRNRGNTAPVYLSGFSLGANVVLKCLGELSDRAFSTYNIHGAAVLSSPLDQEKNSRVFGQPFSIQRFVYTNHLLASLRKRAEYQLKRFANGDPNTNLFDYDGIVNAETISDFDTAFIAKIYGFDNCWDYYAQTSSGKFLKDITVPTLVLNALDDPFFDPNVWPVEHSYEYGGTAPVKMIRTAHGGHLGFSFQKVDPNDQRLKEKPQIGWASIQVARFLDYVQRCTNQL